MLHTFRFPHGMQAERGRAFKCVVLGLWQTDKNVSVRNFKARHGFKEGQQLTTAVGITVILGCPTQH